jgi:hypothetical protein
LVKDGPYIGVMTWFGMPIRDGEEQDRSHSWQCLVRNETTSRAILQGDHTPVEVEGMFLRNIESITKAQYQHLIAHSEWSTKYAPHHADAAPSVAVDLMKLKPPF